MRRACALMLALAMLANGCASVRIVDPDAPGKVLRELNASAEGKPVRVELLSGERFSGTRIHAASDSTTWYDPGDQLVAVSTAEIAKVDVVSRGSRVGRGALLGAIPGVLLSISYALSNESDDSGLGGVFCYVALVGGVLLGAALGLVHEGAEETTMTYILNEDSAGFLLEDTP